MDTIANKSSFTPAVKTAAKTPEHISVFWQKAEENRFGILPLLLIVIGCMGGIAAGFSGMQSALKLSMLAVPTMLSLSFILAVAPMRLIVWSNIVALVFDLIVLFV